jgi:hypothetical protein
MGTPLQETLQALLIVQRLDTAIARARKAQAALDDGAAAGARAAAAHGEEDRTRDVWHHLASELKDSELKLNALETKRKSYQQRLYQGTVTNPKELSNIEKEVESLGRQRADLDGRILDLMEKTDQAKTAFERSQAQAAELAMAHSAARESFSAKFDELNIELEGLIRQRADSADAVADKSLLKTYEDIRAKSGGIGLARIEQGACSGCHMALPSFVVKAVKEGEVVTKCDNCGRLLTT